MYDKSKRIQRGHLCFRRGALLIINALGKGYKYRGVPLSSEWLERCGFEKRLINNSFFEYHLPCTPPNYRNEYKLRWWDAETFRSLEWVTVESGSIHKFPCAYLHQLQNLFFALTGEELQIKMP